MDVSYSHKAIQKITKGSLSPCLRANFIVDLKQHFFITIITNRLSLYATSYPHYYLSSKAGVDMPDQQDAHIGKTFGEYRLTRNLGTGTYGTVYKAESQRQQRYVAIKVFHMQLT